MLNVSDDIKRRLSELLGLDIGKVNDMIETIKRKHEVDDAVAIIQILTQHGLVEVAGDIIEDLLLRKSIFKISDLKSGMRNVTIVGRVEVIKKYYEQSQRYAGIILINDGTMIGQIYLPAGLDKAINLDDIRVGDILLIRGLSVVGLLRNKILKMILSEEGVINKIDEERAKKVLGYPLPKVNKLDVSEIISGNFDESAYIHVYGILMAVSSKISTKYGKAKKESIKIILGSLNKFCMDRIICFLSGWSVDEFKRQKFKIGDILELHGVFVKIWNEKKYVMAKNLATFQRTRMDEVSLDNVPQNGWWTFNLKVISRPRVGTYQKNGNTYRYMTFLASTRDGSTVRVVIWNDNIIDDIISASSGDFLRIFGQVKSGKNMPEIHVQSNIGDVIRIQKPEEWRDSEGIQVAVPREKIVAKVKELKDGSWVSFIGKIRDVKEIESEKIAGIAVLEDGEETIKLLVWDSVLLEDLKGSINSLVKISNVRTARDRNDESKLILITTKRTNVEIIARNFDFSKISLINMEEFGVIDDLSIGEKAIIAGTVVKIEWIGRISLCKKCGGLIVDSEKKICEMGHIGQVIEKEVVAIMLDNGFSQIMAVIPFDILPSTIVDYNKAEKYFEDMISSDICISGTLRIDYSSGIPIKMFIVDKIIDQNSFLEQYLCML